MAVQARTDRRFHRVHVKPSRRRLTSVTVSRLVLWIVLISGVALASFFLPSVFLSTGFFRVDSFTVRGDTHVSQGEILALIGPLREQNILTADLDIYRQYLMASGWVKTATLRRVLPSTIEVTVEERSPVGLARLGERLYLIDSGGAVIAEHGRPLTDHKLPIIDGLLLGSGRGVDETRAQLASNLISAILPYPELLLQVSQVDVSNPHNAVILLNDSPTLIHLGEDRFAERFQKYLDLLPSLRSHVLDIDYIDLRFDRRLFIRPSEPGFESVPLVVSSDSRRVEIQ